MMTPAAKIKSLKIIFIRETVTSYLPWNLENLSENISQTVISARMQEVTENIWSHQNLMDLFIKSFHIRSKP